MANQAQNNDVDFDADIITNESHNDYLGEWVETRVSRRQVLGGGLGAGAAMMLGSFALAGCDDDDPTSTPVAGAPALGFTAVAKSLDDIVYVPAGYSFSVLYALGDPIDGSTAAWTDAGTESGDSYRQRAGDHHDGMSYFGLGDDGRDDDNSDRGILCINHENITQVYLHASGSTFAADAVRNTNEATRELYAHGISVIEIEKDSNGVFQLVAGSAYNHRITPTTAMEFSGPAAGSRFLVTVYDSTGYSGRGTINNCANGQTPWGTYMTCEENWAFYFRRDNDTAERTEDDDLLLRRYGIKTGNTGSYKWSTVASGDDPDKIFARWNATAANGNADDGSEDFRNEPNTFGWVVEIDPFNPDATPKKRTALGRGGHEGAVFAPAVSGKPIVIYMGDDARFEYLYKFVSAENWNPDDAAAGLAAGDKYLDAGTLYVAKFNANGSGQWLELTHLKNGLTGDNAVFAFTSQAAVVVAARLAADVVGATKMDRPEWTAVNPRNGEVYMTLTNNSRRGDGSVSSEWAEQAAGADIAVDAANPRSYDSASGSFSSSLNGNVHGHIIRWQEAGGVQSATTFTWDIYLFGAPANTQKSGVFAGTNLSLLDDSNDLSSPDGLWFDARGMLWIQTDDGAYTDTTNCMMLTAVPGKAGDGAAYDVPKISGTQKTYVGEAPGSNLRRFLVGPKGCEITGVCMTPDYKSLFVNIQHPGEDGDLAAFQSHWPDIENNPASTARPRSATLVIRRDDGGQIGV